jgi:putative ABC transport system ATP-binding protein
MTSTMTEEHAAQQETAGAVVQADEITRIYGKGETAVHALNGCSVAVGNGELTAVMGPSGSGKSTMMHILAGLDRPTSGSVRIQGIDITELGDNELTKLRRQHIGFIFQFFNLLPMLTAEENVRLPLELSGGKVDEEWVEEVIKRTGLSDRKTHRPAELSGGQQQRVAIARALASRPTVIFADEPTGNLDSRSAAELLKLTRAAVEAFGQTVVMVTHDPTAASYADRVVFLADGRIVHEATSPTVEKILDALKGLGS